MTQSPAGAQDTPATTTTAVPSTGGAGTASQYHVIPAMIILGVSVLVIGMALYFAYRYHRRLLETLERLTRGGSADGHTGQVLLIQNDDAMVQEFDPEQPLEVTGPDTVDVGQTVTYEVRKAHDLTRISWTVVGAGAKPASGSGATITLKFASAGDAKVVATEADPGGGETRSSVPRKVAVNEPAPESAQGIVLPFVIKNWGRLVVTLLGIGVIAAMMTMGVIQSEAGIAVLGTLLGVGAASSHGDGAVAAPPIAPPPAAPPASPPAIPRDGK